MASDVSTSRGFSYDVDTIVRRAYQLAGLMEVNQGTASPEWAAKAAMGRDLLDMIVDSLQAEGVAARPVIFRNITLVSGTFEYTMASDVLDVVGDGMYIDPTNSDVTKAEGETLVKQIDREAWQRLSSKGSTGRPTLFMALRNNDFVVRLWPVPDSSDDGGQIRFQIHQYYADTLEGDKDVDLRNYWNRFLIYQLGHDLAVANSLPVDRLSYMNKRAKEQKDYARAYANQHVANYMHIQHTTSWGRNRR